MPGRNGPGIAFDEVSSYLFFVRVCVGIRVRRFLFRSLTSIDLVLYSLIDRAQFYKLSSSSVSLLLQRIAVGGTAFHVRQPHRLSIETCLVGTGRFKNLEEIEILF